MASTEVIGDRLKALEELSVESMKPRERCAVRRSNEAVGTREQRESIERAVGGASVASRERKMFFFGAAPDRDRLVHAWFFVFFFFERSCSRRALNALHSNALLKTLLLAIFFARDRSFFFVNGRGVHRGRVMRHARVLSRMLRSRVMFPVRCRVRERRNGEEDETD